jgi:AcrR family transcriptional regulator
MNKEFKEIIAKIRSYEFPDGIGDMTIPELAEKVDIPVDLIYKYVEDEKDLIRHVLKFERESFKHIFDVHNFDGVNAIDILLTVSKEIATKFRNVSPGITFDLKEKYPDVYKRHFKSRMDFIFGKIKINLQKGIAQGIYRDDLSIELIARLYLSRLIDLHDPDFFPPEEFNFETLFDAMFESHIRSIANEEGLKYWEKKKRIFKKELKKEEIQ